MSERVKGSFQRPLFLKMPSYLRADALPRLRSWYLDAEVV